MLPFILLLIATMLWGSSFIALKIAFAEYSPMWVIFLRMVVASICFLLMWKGLSRFTYQKGDWKLLLLMSAAEPCLYFVFEAMALQYTSAAQAGMVTAVLPPMAAALAFIFLKERMAIMAQAGFVIAFAGLVWLSWAAEENAHASNPVLGNTLELAAMACSAVYCVCVKKLSTRYSPLVLTSLQAFSGAIFFMPLAFSQDVPPLHAGPALYAIVFLGVCVTLGAYLLYNIAITKMDLSKATIFSNLIPVYTIGFAYWLLDETLTQTQLMACGLILSGVVLGQSKRRKKTVMPAERAFES
ncbi:DMT family transporter [Alteromonas sp. 1_MG-2023]|uniref:DMT family transporter n=1 Tax=Alteromonas sp. 1_MG-2023 TaxID=3062669 RepID=UPI0026E44700|nr:DMT family transporter [Alteromonas sp. 1_MG-2023]MDO6477012.1 DMT family transporter [Alteromonas sp. 1_MG-2023]